MRDPLPQMLPILRVDADGLARDVADHVQGPLSASAPAKATHQSLKAALRRVLSYELPAELASRVDVWFAHGVADAWVAGVERDLYALLRHLVEHALRRSCPGGRIEIVVQGRRAGVEVIVRDRAPEVDIGVLLDEHCMRHDAPSAAADLAALHVAALHLGARVLARSGVHAGSPKGLQLAARFPPPFGLSGQAS